MVSAAFFPAMRPSSSAVEAEKLRERQLGLDDRPDIHFE
jgi:hypothetical protein